MIQSAKPRKQRKFRFTAADARRGRTSSTLTSQRSSAAKLGIKRRSIEVRKGDTVKVMSGDNKGKSGKVVDVELRTGRIRIDGIVRKGSREQGAPYTHTRV